MNESYEIPRNLASQNSRNRYNSPEAIVVFSRYRERVLGTFAFIMKPKRTHARKPAAIPNSRWLAYTTAGMASAFDAANSAEGTIHYSGPINRIFKECAEANF